MNSSLMDISLQFWSFWWFFRSCLWWKYGTKREAFLLLKLNSIIWPHYYLCSIGSFFTVVVGARNRTAVQRKSANIVTSSRCCDPNTLDHPGPRLPNNIVTFIRLLTKSSRKCRWSERWKRLELNNRARFWRWGTTNVSAESINASISSRISGRYLFRL